MKKTILSLALCLLLVVSNLAAIAVSADDNYVECGVYLQTGTATYETDTSVEYTAFYLEPEEVGKYTVTCAEQKIALAGYNWVTLPLSPETVNADTIEWSCSSVGQSIIVAVESGNGSVTLTVTREEQQQKEEVQWTIYENETTPTAFTAPFASSAIVNVNTADAVVDCAVLGADGYYHLNTADGPILFAKLNETKMSLQAMADVGQVKEVLQDTDLTVLSKTDFTQAVNDYVACMDSKTGLYPLTVDLIAVYQRVGASKSWYGTGILGGELEDAWMFACYYVEDFTSFETPAGDLNGDYAVDASDATALFMYINGAAELADETAADFNGDGVVNLRDAAKLFYTVNGVI